jgi:hypothetical protein
MDKNVKNVIVQLRSRAEQGMNKYGVNTERKDLTNLEWLQHLQEELMDASVYIEKLKSEMEDMAGMEWRKDRRGEKGWPKKDFNDSAIQYHGKAKNYKQQQEND